MDRLDNQPWMKAPDTRAVVEALSAGGSEVRFVGGCLRDALIGTGKPAGIALGALKGFETFLNYRGKTKEGNQDE